jgi:hypothetical protein
MKPLTSAAIEQMVGWVGLTLERVTSPIRAPLPTKFANRGSGETGFSAALILLVGAYTRPRRLAMTKCSNMIRHCDESMANWTEGDVGTATVDHIVAIAPPAAGDGIATLGLAACRELTATERLHSSPNNRINHSMPYDDLGVLTTDAPLGRGVETTTTR